MFNFLLTIGFFVFIIFIVRLIIKEFDSDDGFYRKAKYAIHGLRCYSEGLNKSEQEVVNSIAAGLNTKEYYIFNNVMLKTTNGSTQVDHIVVSLYGIFVIETKDYSGWIFGDKHSALWTQVLRGGVKNSFQNPFRQNYLHVKTLQEYLPFVDGGIFKSLVVFTRHSEFKTKMPEEVKYIDEITQYILSFKNKILSRGSYLVAIGKISELCQTVDISPEEHVASLNTRHGNSN